MKKTYFIAALVILFAHPQTFSQSQELPKFEVAAEFTTLEREAFTRRTEPGVGGRFTYNRNRVLVSRPLAISFQSAAEVVVRMDG